jgi:hypothetical protein
VTPTHGSPDRTSFPTSVWFPSTEWSLYETNAICRRPRALPRAVRALPGQAAGTKRYGRRPGEPPPSVARSALVLQLSTLGYTQSGQRA